MRTCSGDEGVLIGVQHSTEFKYKTDHCSRKQSRHAIQYRIQMQNGSLFKKIIRRRGHGVMPLNQQIAGFITAES